jgi:glyoxylase-like metal-dependent hydrolase (beta-lactamase superfamily II)
LFADVENFWRNRRAYHIAYEYVRNDFYTLTSSVPVAAKLVDYEKFKWGDRDFFILPTPGHTLGSITLLAEVDGKKVAFSGDLMHSPGKVITLYDMQFRYSGPYEGLDFTIFSLAKLREERPQLLCPSHGKPLVDPDDAIRETSDRLTEYYRFGTGQKPTVEIHPFAVSPHLIASYKTHATFYAIMSDSGKAMFIDYGLPSSPLSESFVRATPVNSRIRFIEHNIDTLKERFGLKSIDVAMPSHTHDDHYGGFSHLKRHYGTKIWCYENMVDILLNPNGHQLGCLVAEPLKIDQSFHHKESFRWEEYQFTITHNPGHTEYQMALFVTIDGQRVAFSGDAFFDVPSEDPERAMRHNLIFRNHVESDSHRKSLRNLMEFEPHLIAPGHGSPFQLTKEMISATERRINKQVDFFSQLVADPECNFGLDPAWVKIYPYQMYLRAGVAAPVEIRVRNYRPTPMKMEVVLVLPPGWRTDPEVLRFEAPPKGKASGVFRLLPTGEELKPGTRLAIAADVMADGRHLGQITEAVVNIEGTG